MSDTPDRALIPRIVAWLLERTIIRAYLRYSDHRGPQLADSITYRALFGVFAGVLLVFSYAALLLQADPAARAALVDALDSVVPGLVGENGVIDVSDIGAAGFDIAGIISLVGLVGALIGVVAALRSALRNIGNVNAADGFFLLVMLRNLALAVVIGLLLVASAAATFVGAVSIQTVTGWLGIPASDGGVAVLTRILGLVIVFALNTLVVAVSFRTLSGVRSPARALWTGAAIGGFGLLVLQELSGLFVSGATSNPLLGTFASLIALLLWFNLSSQVILIASSVIFTITDEQGDRVRVRYGASTFAKRRVQLAEDAVSRATEELELARAAAAPAEEKPARD